VGRIERICAVAAEIIRRDNASSLEHSLVDAGDEPLIVQQRQQAIEQVAALTQVAALKSAPNLNVNVGHLAGWHRATRPSAELIQQIPSSDSSHDTLEARPAKLDLSRDGVAGRDRFFLDVFHVLDLAN